MIWGCLGGHLIVRTTQNGASEILGESGKSDQTAKNLFKTPIKLFKTNMIYICNIYYINILYI